ncbi:MAG TPA: ribosome maturation factor RimM [Alphaproteobacteria bacterium]|nr:ribosome maturation factor RimM [Alphaproteobacteria bacterium]
MAERVGDEAPEAANSQKADKRNEARICLGVVAGAHGVRGALRVKSFAAAPDDIAAYGPLTDEAGRRNFTLRVVGHARGALVIEVDGVNDRNAAEALKGTRFYVARAVLPEPEADEFYHADLIGLRAEDEGGAALGTVRAVHDHGAGALIDIRSQDGAELLVAFTRAAVPVVDLAAGRIVVVPPDEVGEAESAHEANEANEANKANKADKANKANKANKAGDDR